MTADGKVDGASASDCINNFRRLGEEGMRQQMADPKTIAANDKAAAGATPADHATASQAAQAASAREREAKRRQEQGEATQAEVDQATADRQAADRQLRRVQASCRAAQGRAIAGGNGANHPRNPSHRGQGVPGTQANRGQASGTAGDDDE